MLHSKTQFNQHTVFDYNVECAWELCTLLHVVLSKVLLSKPTIQLMNGLQPDTQLKRIYRQKYKEHNPEITQLL